MYSRICDIMSTIDLSKAILDDHEYFFTRNTQQDPLEHFFGSVRAGGGWNDNPNAAQFKYSLRKILAIKIGTMLESTNGNCTAQLDTLIESGKEEYLDIELDIEL